MVGCACFKMLNRTIICTSVRPFDKLPRKPGQAGKLPRCYEKLHLNRAWQRLNQQSSNDRSQKIKKMGN